MPLNSHSEENRVQQATNRTKSNHYFSENGGDCILWCAAEIKIKKKIVAWVQHTNDGKKMSSTY